MLVKFSFSNFKTFREEAALTLVASADNTRQSENVIGNLPFNFNLLKSAVVYGANASGKSKMMEAFLFMRNFALISSKETQVGEKIGVQPFLLSTETVNQPSLFEIIFIHNNGLYRYGFEADQTRIVSEWLFYRPKTKEIELFYRNEQNFDVHSRLFSKGLSLVNDKMIRENALLLSVAAQFNDKIAANVLDWFKGFRIISALVPEGYKGYSVSCLEDDRRKGKILEMLRSADLGIEDIHVKMTDPEDLPDDVPEMVRNAIHQGILNKKRKLVSVETKHPITDQFNQIVGSTYLNLDSDESSGTRQFFALTGPIIDVLENGRILFIDELDSQLHPNLVEKITEIFNSEEMNPNNAQLIFNTHNTNLLSAGIFRRDQIWFIEKDRYGAAKMFSLSDFKNIRKETNFENSYIVGKYGAVPVLQDFEAIYKTGEENIEPNAE